MLEDLRFQVCKANLELVSRGLVISTFGNVSAISRPDALVVIKPSGVPYDQLRPEDMVITDLETGVVEGNLRPSSDVSTHVALYKAFSEIGGVVHTHSRHATAWAQARREIPCLGTTHADYFCGSIPVTDEMRDEEIETDYESNTGSVIVRALEGRDPLGCPAVLVAGHGPFCWGRSAEEAVDVAEIVEELAAMAWQALTINPSLQPISETLRNKHYFRKHGPKSYYGQLKRSTSS